MKRNTLYTANSFNQRMFYSEGGDMPVDEKKPVIREKKRHTGKLVTVNKWNMPAFVQRKEENIFGIGGSTSGQMTLDTSQIKPGSVNFANTTPDLNTSNGLTGSAKQAFDKMTLQNSMASAYQMGAQSKSGMFSGKGGAMAQAGMAAGMSLIDTIDTGDKRGLWDTLDPVYHLAGGRESAAGNIMSDAGVSLTKAGLQSGQPYMAIAGAALKVVGGLTNAAFGIKANEELKKAADQSISENSNFVSNASSFDEIKGPSAITNTNIYEGGWFSGGTADEKNEEYKERMRRAASWAYRSVGNNVANLQGDQLSNALANYSAFGGYLTRPKKKRKIKR